MIFRFTNLCRDINLLCRRCVSSVRDEYIRLPGNIVVRSYHKRKMRCACFILFWRVSRECAAALQWRLGSVVLDGMRVKKKGRRNDNCVLNGAGYAAASHIYVTPESEQSFTRVDTKTYFVKLFFALISMITKIIAQYLFDIIYWICFYFSIYFSSHST